MNKRVVFTGIAMVGVAATTVTSYICGYKTNGKRPSKENWKHYILPVVFGSVTLASIVASHKLGTKEIAALTATCAYLKANRDKLEKKIEEKFGKEALDEIRKEVSTEMAIEYKGESIEDTGNGELLCLDGYSGRWFWSSEEAVLEAEKKFNKMFETDRNVSLNDFYKLLGIGQTHFGHQFGWVNDEDWYDPSGIEFENNLIFDEELNQQLFIIEITTYPMEAWQEI